MDDDSHHSRYIEATTGMNGQQDDSHNSIPAHQQLIMPSHCMRNKREFPFRHQAS